MRSYGNLLLVVVFCEGAVFKIKRGLDLPIAGGPDQVIRSTPSIKKVAVTGPDYLGMKPTMKVKEGDTVSLGTPLFEDKKNPGVLFPAPAAGKVVAINRGDKRALLSVVIAVSGQDAVAFKSHTKAEILSMSPADLEAFMVATGQWLHLRTRPYSRTPALGTRPHAIFITAMDTNPFAPDVSVVMKGNEEAFKLGATALSRFTETVYVCSGPDSQIPHGYSDKIKGRVFAGPHPAGLAGTHIHFLDPVGKEKTVWWLNYQDVIALGRTLTTGKIDNMRVISVAGPRINEPCLMKVPVGACLQEIVAHKLADKETARVISGSVLNGRKSEEGLCYLGHFHHQVVALAEGTEREFLGWQKPGFNKFSVTNIFASRMLPGKRFRFTTSTEGSRRAMVPIGSYEKVMPLDIEPTYLLRSLFTGDTEEAQRLGILELDEEDLALCTYVCATKEDYGPLLRKNLTQIERDG